MRVIIAHLNTKREINGPFNICGSKEDLLNIATQIFRACENGFHYGWIEVADKKQVHLQNLTPIGWEE